MERRRNAVGPDLDIGEIDVDDAIGGDLGLAEGFERGRLVGLSGRLRARRWSRSQPEAPRNSTSPSGKFGGDQNLRDV